MNRVLSFQVISFKLLKRNNNNRVTLEIPETEKKQNDLLKVCVKLFFIIIIIKCIKLLTKVNTSKSEGLRLDSTNGMETREEIKLVEFLQNDH